MCQKAIVTDHNIQKICRQGSIPQVLHTLRINLSPFTKDFRVWGTYIETQAFFVKLPFGDLWINEGLV